MGMSSIVWEVETLILSHLSSLTDWVGKFVLGNRVSWAVEWMLPVDLLQSQTEGDKWLASGNNIERTLKR